MQTRVVSSSIRLPFTNDYLEYVLDQESKMTKKQENELECHNCAFHSKNICQCKRISLIK